MGNGRIARLEQSNINTESGKCGVRISNAVRKGKPEMFLTIYYWLMSAERIGNCMKNTDIIFSADLRGVVNKSSGILRSNSARGGGG